MSDDDLLGGPARDAELEAIEEQLSDLLSRTYSQDVDGFYMDDDDRRELDRLKAELNAYRNRLGN